MAAISSQSQAAAVGRSLAVAAGGFAALASVMGKLATHSPAVSAAVAEGDGAGSSAGETWSHLIAALLHRGVSLAWPTWCVLATWAGSVDWARPLCPLDQVTDQDCISIQTMSNMLQTVVGFALVILCNALMWTLFSTALSKCKTSLEATALSMVSNFCLSAILGHLFFSEPLPVQWWIGTCAILIGALIISSDRDSTQPPPAPRRES
ncbi:hypothetical protein CAOG_04497 [Capsaspora owczarzaki ATCC 30864]|uniref:EamA domain-containing protein n=1 Tax=Capsaspora owczarzaki (strain ATCC 30864) TaxID=595528 RepID=A0A0D2WRC9_CAPO3|nr:hypothetical protein CAOG_04497 [Capsaspora owczarzaki ATCC 30864]KJE93748.1 hypothetical protein CAOG_004497 [Capsaspora owczarzaki ATCC 30864]|eukprot:XP_004348325.1 hypothetical protein CAOG_04497 [Capsaspora owczarzaki ATCC 30864]